jgi:hypothetical protein
MHIDAYIKTQSKGMLYVYAVLLTLFIGYIDYLTGFELRIDVFLFNPDIACRLVHKPKSWICPLCCIGRA